MLVHVGRGDVGRGEASSRSRQHTAMWPDCIDSIMVHDCSRRLQRHTCHAMSICQHEQMLRPHCVKCVMAFSVSQYKPLHAVYFCLPVVTYLQLGQSCTAMKAAAQISNLVLLQNECIQLRQLVKTCNNTLPWWAMH